MHIFTGIGNCDPEPCLNGGTCVEGDGTFTCDCAAGYTGTLCETGVFVLLDVDVCLLYNLFMFFLHNI